MFHGKSNLSRRRFLTTAAKAGAVLAAPMFVPGTVLGKSGGVAASERITLAGLGIGGRGNEDPGLLLEEPVVQFVAIADIRKDSPRKRQAEGARTKYGPGVATYRDFREMLPRQDIDAVLIATGDRWHTMASICAAKAGKDIYCEKPCSMTIAESQALADTMRRYGRIYQAGTQRRSIANFIFAADLCHGGKLGKLTKVHANTLHPGTNHDWLPAQPEPPKDEVDWDLWLGPTPWRPFNQAYVDGGWRGYFDFHGGGILEWGAHTVDLCNWAGTNDEEHAYEPLRARWTPRRLHRHLAERVETGYARSWLDGSGHVQRPLRRRRRLGRDGRHRPAGVLLRPAPRRAAGSSPRPAPRRSATSRTSSNRIKTRACPLERRGGRPQPHHLPRRLYRLAAWPAFEARSGQGGVHRRR